MRKTAGLEIEFVSGFQRSQYSGNKGWPNDVGCPIGKRFFLIMVHRIDVGKVDVDKAGDKAARLNKAGFTGIFIQNILDHVPRRSYYQKF